VVYPPGKHPVTFTAYLQAQHESCDRFMRLEFFGHLPTGVEAVQSMITYSEKHECYRMWCFVSSHDEPILMQGEIMGPSLVFMSDPTDMASGIEKMRCTFTPNCDGVFDFNVEFWTIDGYVPYFRAQLVNALDAAV